MIGTAVAQFELRRYLGVLNALVMNTPSVMIGQASDKFDEHGRLTDQTTRDMISKVLRSLVDWTRRVGQAVADPGRVQGREAGGRAHQGGGSTDDGPVAGVVLTLGSLPRASFRRRKKRVAAARRRRHA